MNQPYNEATRDTEKTRQPRPPRSNTRQQRKSIFRSTAINLTALLLLFTLVFVLQGWGKWVGIDSDKEAEQTQTTDADAKVADKEEAKSAPKAKAETTPQTKTAVAKSKSSVYTLEEKPKAKAKATPQKKKTVTKRPKKQEYRARRVRVSPSDPYAQDKKVSVEEFDNELARRRYRNENQRLSGEIAGDTVAETRYQPSHTQGYSATRPSHSSSNNTSSSDLDGESARQRYNSENRRLSGPDANLE